MGKNTSFVVKKRAYLSQGCLIAGMLVLLNAV